MLISARIHTATCQGSIRKEVRCEKCQVEYAYTMKRTRKSSDISPYGINDGGAAQGAARDAANWLARDLLLEYDPVPCPSCGQYQEHMFPALRDLYRPGLWRAALVLLAGSVVVLLIGIVRLMQSDYRSRVAVWIMAAAAAMLVAGLVLIVTRVTLAYNYDPNQGDAEARKRHSRGQVIKKTNPPGTAE